MITLKYLFDTLAQGELLNLSLSDTATGELSTEHYPKIVGHINLGLIELYKRFNLLQGSINLHQYEGIDTYYLRKNNVGYLDEMDDTIYFESENFQENIVKIVAVYDELGVPVPLNETKEPTAVITLAHDTLFFKDISIPQIMTLEYQAYYPKITMTETFNPATVKLYIPDFILEALQAYVASRVYKPMGSNTSSADADKSTSYLQLYELACTKIDTLRLDTQMSQERDTFSTRGFV